MRKTLTKIALVVAMLATPLAIGAVFYDADAVHKSVTTPQAHASISGVNTITAGSDAGILINTGAGPVEIAGGATYNPSLIIPGNGYIQSRGNLYMQPLAMAVGTGSATTIYAGSAGPTPDGGSANGGYLLISAGGRCRANRYWRRNIRDGW